MTQLTIDIEDASLLPMLKKLISTMNGVTIRKIEKSNYNPEFIKKIEKGNKDLQTGKGTKITVNELHALWK